MLKSVWNKIINNGVHEGLSFDQITQIRISNAISIVGSIFASSYAIYLAYNNEFRLAGNDVLFISNLFLLYVFNYLRFYRIGTILTFITLPLTLLYVNYEYGKIGTEYFYYASIVLCFYYFKNIVNQYITSIYLILLIILTNYLETIITPKGFAGLHTNYILLSNIFMSSAILFVSISLFINQHKKYQIEIDQKNKLLEESLKETQQKNEQVNLVLKELNHRVKNNLQMVSSLFNIQSYKTKNKETKQALKDARNRIVSIAIMHQKLYKDNLFYEVKLKKYIEELVEYIIQSASDENIKTIVKVEDIKLRIEDTVHVGLIINELVTNALKYGINTQTNENILKVGVSLIDNELDITVEDSGKGFPKNFNIENTDTFGLELVNSIVTQHNGQIIIENDLGAKINLKLNITEFCD